MVTYITVENKLMKEYEDEAQLVASSNYKIIPNTFVLSLLDVARILNHEIMPYEHEIRMLKRQLLTLRIMARLDNTIESKRYLAILGDEND